MVKIITIKRVYDKWDYVRKLNEIKILCFVIPPMEKLERLEMTNNEFGWMLIFVVVDRPLLIMGFHLFSQNTESSLEQ